MKKSEKLTGSYVVVDDQNMRHTISVYTEFRHTKLLTGETTNDPVSVIHRMSNGNHVNELPDGTLLEVVTQRRMYRV
jgi:hypothetical protein